MNKEECSDIGYFGKPHGYKGQMNLIIDTDDEVNTQQLPFVLLEMNNLLTPFFIEQIEDHHRCLVKLEKIDSDKEAKKFQGKRVWVSNQFVSKSENEESEHYTGYTLIEETKGNLGLIIREEEMPGHDVFVVVIEGKEISLPVVDEFIIEINDDKKEIKYKAPEGLIELYLNE